MAKNFVRDAFRDYTAWHAGKDAAQVFEQRVGVQAQTVAEVNSNKQFTIWWECFGGRELSETDRKEACRSFIAGWYNDPRRGA